MVWKCTVGDEDVPDYLNGLFNRLNKAATIKEIAEKIKEECNERVQGETIRCHVAGYENGLQCLYQVVDGVVTHKNMNPELGVPTICVVWDGQRDISRNIIRNKEKLDIGGKIVDESEFPHFTLDKGVRFAEAVLKRSCEEREECGEPIYSLVITGGGPGKYYNIEVQRKPEGAHIRRARFNSSMMDSRMLKEGQEFSELRDSYMVFITQTDCRKVFRRARKWWQ